MDYRGLSHLSPAELRIRLEAEQGRRSFYWFIKHAWSIVEKSEFQDNWHIEVIAKHLEAVTRGELRKLIINVPPGSGKSSIVSVFWNAWTWIIDPTKEFLYTSFDGDLTARDARKVRQLVSSAWFQQRWGGRTRVNENEPIKDFKVYNGSGAWAGGGRFSTSVDGKTTGRHPHIKVIDDPTKPKEATRENLEMVKAWWQHTMRSRGNPTTVATVLIMQRLDEDDLAGYFLSREQDWTHVRIPLEYEPDEAFATKWGRDPRTEPGESFWKERFPPEAIAEIKRDIPDVGIYSAQYQQNPTPAGGTIFLKDWFTDPHLYDLLPENGLEIQSWDFAFKDLKSSDWVVGGVWRAVGPSFYKVDHFRERVDFVGSCEAMRAMTKKHPKCIGKVVEDKANGPAVMSQLRREIPGIVPFGSNDSKVARARAVQPLFAAGNVFYPRGALWLFDYQLELTKFPRGKNDDQVDETTQALIYLASNSDHVGYQAALERWIKLAKGG